MIKKYIIRTMLVICAAGLVLFFSADFLIRHLLPDGSTVGAIHFYTFPTRLEFVDVRYHFGDPQITAVDAEAKKVYFRISIINLFKKHVVADQINVDELNVLITEGDLKTPESHTVVDESSWNYSVNGIIVTDGKFTYKRLLHNTLALLKVSNISVNTSAMTTVQPLKMIQAVAHGRLENSGEFTLKLDATLNQKPLNLGIQLEMNDQNLSDISLFFRRLAGIELSGRLIGAKSNIQIRNTSLVGWTQVKYEQLNIRILKNSTRNSIAVFFANLIQKFTVHSSNSSTRESQQYQSVRLERLQYEPIIPFILRGMKDAALEVTGKN